MSTMPLFGPLLGDRPTEALFTEAALARALLDVEVTLARVQGRVGVIPASSAERIAAVADALLPDLVRVASSTRQHGVPVVELVAQLAEGVGTEIASDVHWGATSQDIVDTALVLQIREALALLEGRLRRVVDQLCDLAARYRDTPMAGRTRWQQAVPITFGLKVATWLAPLLRHRERLTELRPRLLLIQLGGAAGTLASLGDRGQEVVDACAEELGLGVPVLPWHTQRDGLVELGGWLSLLTGGLGKMAQDILLMVQTEVAELAESSSAESGRSSTMPQKHNPVRSEAIVAAARHNASLLSSLHQSLLHEHERSGLSWQLEWLALPQMLVLTGGALANALDVLDSLHVRPERMHANLSASNGLLLAEAASFLLAGHMTRADARATVSAASTITGATGQHLIDVLRERVDLPIDWGAIRDESSYLGAAGPWIDAVLERARPG